MFNERKKLYSELESLLNTKLIVYVTSDKPGMETQIARDALNFIVPHLDSLGEVQKISLLLHTNGGDTLAAWSIANLIRQFCKNFEVIIPFKALSSGTLISLGADSILMTKQAVIGPIDPTVNNPLNPQIPGAPPHAKAGVSVEAIKGYLELVREELDIKNEQNLTEIVLKLSDKIHPLALGDVYRAKSQIQMLAKRLLKHQVADDEKIKQIVDFLCSGSGSHDYTINRREAKDTLGLKIEKPTQQQYEVINKIFNDIQTELELNTRWDPNCIIANVNVNTPTSFRVKRGLIESLFDSYVFVTEGNLTKIQIAMPGTVPQVGIQDNRTFEGWRKI